MPENNYTIAKTVSKVHKSNTCKNPYDNILQKNKLRIPIKSTYLTLKSTLSVYAPQRLRFIYINILQIHLLTYLAKLVIH